MASSNGEIIRKAYQDFSTGNIAAVFAAFDAAITGHVPGHRPLSGDFTGDEQIGAFFRRTMELSGGAFTIEVHNVLTDDDLVSVSIPTCHTAVAIEVNPSAKHIGVIPLDSEDAFVIHLAWAPQQDSNFGAGHPLPKLSPASLLFP